VDWKKCLPQILLLAAVVAAVSGCTLNRPNETAGDIIAPLAPKAQAETGAEPGAQGSVTVFVQPASQEINPGDPTTAEIWVRDVSNLAAVDLKIQFDPDVLQVQDADGNKPGIQAQPGDFLEADFVVKNDVDNDTGVVHYTITQIAPTPPASGTGLLLLIEFEAIDSGTSTISLPLVQLASGDAQSILANVQTGVITVKSADGVPPAQPTQPPATPITSQPTATFTPLPTSQPVPITATPAPPAAEDGAPVEPQGTLEAEIAATPTATFTPTSTPTATPTFTPTPIIPIPQPVIPPNATLGFCYRTLPGDSLESLSAQYGTTPFAINLANDLNPPYYVKPYQTIFVPTYLGHGPNVYQTQPQETLNIIAERCKLPVEMLIRVNHIDVEAIPLAPSLVPSVPLYEAGVTALIIPIPPFPPPSRYQYPALPIIPYQEPYPIHK